MSLGNRNQHTIHDENVDRLVSVLERIALALEGKNAPVILSFPQVSPEDVTRIAVALKGAAGD